MGSLHHNLYDENKKLKEKIQSLEDEIKEKGNIIIEQTEKLNKSKKELEMYRSAAVLISQTCIISRKSILWSLTRLWRETNLVLKSSLIVLKLDILLKPSESRMRS
jgi:uncharacterized coiled-coil DUF342 family protein